MQLGAPVVAGSIERRALVESHQPGIGDALLGQGIKLERRLIVLALKRLIALADVLLRVGRRRGGEQQCGQRQHPQLAKTGFHETVSGKRVATRGTGAGREDFGFGATALCRTLRPSIISADRKKSAAPKNQG